MTRLRATFQFDIGELLVRREELGSSHVLARHPPVHLHLPHIDEFEEWQTQDSPFTGSIKGSSDQPPELLGVRYVRTTVDLDADLSAAEFPQEANSTWPTDRAMKVYNRAFDHARDAYQRFRAWAHVSGDYHWIGVRYDEPQFAGVQSLVDLDLEQRIPIGYPPIHHIIVAYTPEEREQVPTVAAIVQNMGSGEPPLAPTLLADAKAIYSYRTRAADHQRAVLLAAIASEIAIKQRLRELASPDMADLVAIIMSNPQEVTQSPPQLLHKAFKAVTGVSLSDDDQPLYKDVEKRLFTLRNHVAHRGLLPTEEQGRKAVDIASRLARWLAARQHKSGT